MWNKKVRGQRRKLKALLKAIENHRDFFDFEGKFNCLEVPSDPWIEKPKTYGKVKTAFCRKWIEETERLISQTPEDVGFCKVVGAIVYPELWNSQIIIFKDKEYYDSFFERKGPYQTWTRITYRSFAAERNITTGLQEFGFVEDLVDEDFEHRSYIWFYMDQH